MPAVVKCPNGCKLRVPASKAFDSFQCPKCSASIRIPPDETDRFQANPKSILNATLSSELVNFVSDDILFIDGSRDDDELKNPSSAYTSNNVIPPEIPVEHRQSNLSTSPIEAAITPPTIPSEEPGDDAPDPAKEKEAFQVLTKSIDEEESKIRELEETLSQARSSHGSMLDFVNQWINDKENLGIVHNKQICGRAYSLSWAMIVIGTFLLGPVIYTMIGWIGKDYHLPLGRWSYMLIFFSAIQFLYALFLSQIPDWTSTRFVSYLMLGMTVFTTFLLSVSMLSGSDSSLFRFLELSVSERGKVSGWLLVMLIGFGLMSYLCGRTTQFWMEEEARRVV